jgi:3-deoxy-manno-octulosonate cytidylyltransferase (CMP-KDO synthetase)
MASTRLPNKPLADIKGKPMIVRVMERARAAGFGEPIVAAAEKEIADAVNAAGGIAVLTAPELASGTDRIFAALNTYKTMPKYVVNIQGDLPTLDPAAIRLVIEVLQQTSCDIATLACKITRDSERQNPNVVKVVLVADGEKKITRALYFSRATVPFADGDLFHHIGLYAYKIEALKKFVALPPSKLEQREKLEQLRALEAGMSIAVGIIETVPLGVDTAEDLERARAEWQQAE